MSDVEVTLQLIGLLHSAPWLLVITIAGIICLRRLTTRPRESWLVGSALALMLFAWYGLSALINLAFRYLPTTGIEGRWLVIVIYTIPSSIIQAIAWGLLIYTVFGEGHTPRSKYLVENEESQASG